MSSLVDRLWYGGGRPLRWLMPLYSMLAILCFYLASEIYTRQQQLSSYVAMACGHTLLPPSSLDMKWRAVICSTERAPPWTSITPASRKRLPALQP